MTTNTARRSVAAMLFVLHLTFFFYYYHLLRISLSARGFCLLILALGLPLLMAMSLRSRIGLAASWLATAAAGVYLLVNFAYFIAFNTILAPSASQVQAANMLLLNFLTQYADLAPRLLYYLIAGQAIITCLLLYVLYRLNRPQKNTQIFSFNTELEEAPSYRRPLTITATALLVIMMLSLRIFPASGWWDQQKYISDLGIHGFLGNELAGAIVLAEKKLVNPYGIQAQESAKDAAPDAPARTEMQDAAEMLKDLGKITAAPEKTVVSHKTYSRPNIIIYQMESLDAWPQSLDPNPLANITAMENENISVKDFYSNSCETVNAEFSVLCSALPDSFSPINYDYKNNDYRCLPQLLKEKLGYTTSLFHSGDIEFYDRNILAPKWGFEKNYFNNYFRNKEPDGPVTDTVIRNIKMNGGKPFFGYIIGFSNHSPHNQEMLDYYNQHFQTKLSPYAGDIPAELTQSIEADETTMRTYLTFANYVDQNIKHLFDALTAEKLLDNTIVVAYGDHRYYNFFSDDKIADFYRYNRIPFFIYVPERLKAQLQPVASQIDIAPTLLDLLGQEKPANFLGTSLFSTDHPQNAVNKCLSRISYAAPGTILLGNVRSDQYSDLLWPHDLAQDSAQRAADLLKSAVGITNEILKGNKLAE